MPQLRVALAQLDVTVGDIDGNAAAILRLCREAAAQDAHLVAFPAIWIALGLYVSAMLRAPRLPQAPE